MHVSQRTPARSGRPAQPSTPGGGGTDSAPSIPSLKSTSPLLQKTHPAGKGSFWYTTLDGQRCMYVPNAVAPCFNVTPGGRPAHAQPPVDPAVVAAGAAKRLALGPGRIHVSPSPQTEGLAGAPSWFWLDPAPAVRSVSVSVRREHVKVTASARDVRWVFGDGSSLAGGSGVPYRSGEDVPDGAVRHDYQTRCLPGDQGHDPYVLSSCGPRGYAVSAELAWDISFDASGPVSGSGTLPSRTTATSLDYPVSEARGFLTDGDGT
ncbi:MAG TPA: hypothetical protein VF257_07815 [Solirubrobacteraceae bacterium]